MGRLDNIRKFAYAEPVVTLSIVLGAIGMYFLMPRAHCLSFSLSFCTILTFV